MAPKDFEALTEAEARAFLERYVATAAERLERFFRLVAATGRPAREMLDGSPESLVPLHAWFVSRARRADAPDAAGELPEWLDGLLVRAPVYDVQLGRALRPRDEEAVKDFAGDG